MDGDGFLEQVKELGVAASLWNVVPRETTSSFRARVGPAGRGSGPSIVITSQVSHAFLPPEDLKLINYPVLTVWVIVVINEVSSFCGRCGRPQFTGISLWGEEFQRLAQP